MQTQGEFELPDGTIKHAYIAVKDMVNPQVGFKAIHLDYNATTMKDEIKLYIDDPDSIEALTQSDDGLKIEKATNTQYGVSRFATQTELRDAISTPEVFIRPYDVYDFAKNSESVKDDLNTYADATTGEKSNKTIISAINESLTTTVEKKTTPDTGDINTYLVKTMPEAGVAHQLGELIHDKIVIHNVDSLTAVTGQKSYELYYLNQLELPYKSGLYMWDEVNSKWVGVSSGEAIEAVEELPDGTTKHIYDDHFYLLTNEDVINARYKLADSYKEMGYRIDEVGIHFGTTDVSWDAVVLDLAGYVGDELIADADGPVFNVTKKDGTVKLIYGYNYIPLTLYYHALGEWHKVCPPENITLTMIDDLLIED